MVVAFARAASALHREVCPPGRGRLTLLFSLMNLVRDVNRSLEFHRYITVAPVVLWVWRAEGACACVVQGRPDGSCRTLRDAGAFIGSAAARSPIY